MMTQDDSARLRTDFEALCDCGGRLSGTPSEARAVSLLKTMGTNAMGVEPIVESIPYLGWKALHAELTGPDGANHPINPLVRTVPTAGTGIKAEVIDLGRGSLEDFAAHKSEIKGRIVLVRHELMFDPNTVHRRVKYNAAVEAGAVGFLIAGPVAGSMVSGSSGRGGEHGIPAGGISPETASRLSKTANGWPSVKIRIETVESEQVAENLIFDLPGTGPGYVVLSAHIDGHDLAESAMDNGTGLAVALAVSRRLAPEIGKLQRGLRLAFFNVEEWALIGSDRHVTNLTQTEKDGIALNVNLDSVAGGDNLAALTSGFAGIEPFLSACASDADINLDLYRPLQMNSDHANFAIAGIPAFRMVAGFADPTAATSLVLTEKDVRGLVKTEELERAAHLTETIVRAALAADSEEVARWRRN
jgi:aminopeptidase YwaD